MWGCINVACVLVGGFDYLFGFVEGDNKRERYTSV